MIVPCIPPIASFIRHNRPFEEPETQLPDDIFQQLPENLTFEPTVVETIAKNIEKREKKRIAANDGIGAMLYAVRFRRNGKHDAKKRAEEAAE